MRYNFQVHTIFKQLDCFVKKMPSPFLRGVHWQFTLIYTFIQGWIREVNQYFGRACCGERLGESYTWCTGLCGIDV